MGSVRAAGGGSQLGGGKSEKPTQALARRAIAQAAPAQLPKEASDRRALGKQQIVATKPSSGTASS